MFKLLKFMLYKLFVFLFLLFAFCESFDLLVSSGSGILALPIGILVLYAAYKIMTSRFAYSMNLQEVEETDAWAKRVSNMKFRGSSSRASSGDDWRARKAEADRRVWERTKARNEQKFHEYYARKYAGTQSGYFHENRAKAARNRANRY